MLSVLRVCITGQSVSARCSLRVSSMQGDEERPDNSQLERCTTVRRTHQTCSVVVLGVPAAMCIVPTVRMRISRGIDSGKPRPARNEQRK